MNPDRICRMCNLIEHQQKPMSDYLAVLPDYDGDYDSFGFIPNNSLNASYFIAVEEAIPKLREITGDCPACILATLRQKRIHPSDVNGFNYADESKGF